MTKKEEIEINLTSEQKEVIKSLRSGGKLLYGMYNYFHDSMLKPYKRKSMQKLIEWQVIVFKDNTVGYLLTDLGKSLDI